MRFTKPAALCLFVAAATLALAPDSSAGGKKKMKEFMKMMPRPVVVVPSPVVVAPVPYYPAPHVHVYQVFSEQVWVPPVYSQVCVGYDPFGNAVYQQVVSQAGYYRTVQFQQCSCGHKVYL